MEIVKALPGVVYLRISAQNGSFFAHQAHGVEFTADIHPYHQRCIRYSLTLLYLSVIILSMHGGYSSCQGVFVPN